jgi:hypothetical protein
VGERLTSVVWELPGEGAELFALERGHDGSHSLSGTAILAADGVPYRIDYRVGVDAEWRTRAVDVDCNEVEIELTADGGGGWSEARFEGCVDVDLGFTPATNTLPIRRLELEVGDARELDVVWLRFPELALERVTQRYERLADDRYRYSSPGFTAELLVDEHGVVRLYEGLWRAVGRR